VLNAANEVAVQAFLDERLSFKGIARVIERVLESVPVAPVGHFSDLYTVDDHAREVAGEALAGLSSTAGARPS
jgi:1-deoxy-D-xylulose-5-phosphate reductoisomerase